MVADGRAGAARRARLGRGPCVPEGPDTSADPGSSRGTVSLVAAGLFLVAVLAVGTVGGSAVFAAVPFWTAVWLSAAASWPAVLAGAALPAAPNFFATFSTTAFLATAFFAVADFVTGPAAFAGYTARRKAAIGESEKALPSNR